MPSFSKSLENALHQALGHATSRRHEFATLEHLLLALIDDEDASAVMRACNVDLEALRQTAETSGMIFLILLGAEVFGAFLALSQLPTTAATMISNSGFSPYMVLAAMLAFYILLGAVMDELAMILLTLPVFFPVIQALDFGMLPDEVAIWFGILVLMVVGIGLTAPPIGLNVFVIASIAKDVPIIKTYRGVLPFLVTDVIRLILVVLFPGLALWLVRLFN